MTYYTGTSSSATISGLSYGSAVNVMLSMPVYEVPRYAGEGPPLWSTCTDLVVDPVHIHDMNTYYRALGFTWPFRGITKGQLMRAYRDRNGQADEFMTFAFKTLLNKEIRRLYDRIPFGQQMMDKYLWEAIKKKANAVAAEAASQGEELSIEDILTTWGLQTVQADETEPIEPVGDQDEPFGDGDQEPSAMSESDDTVSPTEDPETVERWSWGYFLWRSSCSDEDRLARWQRMLLTAARDLGLRAQLGVGFIGAIPSAWKVGQLTDGYVIFLNDGVEPEEELAVEAVSLVKRMINSNQP